MTEPERDVLIEEVTSAHRERDGSGRIRSHPAFHDLDPADRTLAAARAVELRQLEAALDPRGLSATGRAVLARITSRVGGG